MRNKKLYSLTKNFVEASLDALNKSLENGEKIPSQQIKEVKRTGGQFSAPTVQKPNYTRFILNHVKEIENLIEFKLLKEFILSYKETRKSIACRFKDRKIPDDTAELSSILRDEIITSHLDSYLKNADKLEFDKDIFDELYIQIEEYYYSSELSFKLVAPLYHFWPDKVVEKIDLGDKLIIRMITDEEYSYMWGMSNLTNLNIMDFVFLRFALECQFTKKKEDLLKKQPIENHFYKVITAFRLFKTGAIGLNFACEYPNQWMPRVSPSIIGGQYSKQYPNMGPSYTLSKSESEEFQKYWGTFKQIKLESYPTLNLALRRFNFAQERDELIDKIIDYFIAFEALFLKEEERQELSYRFALRASHFLEKDKTKRIETFNFLKKAYTLRSKIVHGSAITTNVKIGNTNISLKGFTNKNEEYLRKSLFRFLELTKKHNMKEIFKSIDESILS